jgi:hypothetical protein
VRYDEPKRLVRLGLATARSEPAGRRTRTAYAITDEGGRALGAWLATQPGPPRFEFETMLRLVYADQGTKEEFLGAVQAARSWAKAPIYGWARAGPGLPATSSSTCSRPWPLGPSVILATGCAGQHGGADIKHAPAPATTDARPPGNHEGHGRSRGGRTSDPSR